MWPCSEVGLKKGKIDIFRWASVFLLDFSKRDFSGKADFLIGEI